MTFEEAMMTYKFKGKIGKGTAGEIFLAWHSRLGKDVVLKRIKKPSNYTSENKTEINILKNLRHQALPGVIDFIEIDGELFTVMDYITGQTLETWMETNTPSIPEIQSLCDDICSALNLLHSQNPPIIHCDIKPANIMVKPGCHGVLIDFNTSLDGGVSYHLGSTPGFSSPELDEAIAFAKTHHQFPQGMITPQSDIYEMACVIYWMITHQKYEPGNGDWELVARNSVPEIVPVLQKALQNDCNDRTHTITEFNNGIQSLKYKNERVQAVKKKNRRLTIFYSAGLSISVVFALLSIGMVQKEKKDTYFQIVDQMVEKLSEGQFSEAESLYNEAREILPDNLDAYYHQAQALYEQGHYEQCSDFINRSILTNPKLMDQQANEANVYYLLADSWYRQNNYKASVDVYEQLFNEQDENNLQPAFYRDYAIALAKNKDLSKAEKVLKDAVEKGLDDASLQYAQAEIEYSKGNVQEAIALMSDTLTKLDDSNVLMHAYYSLADWYSKIDQKPEAQEVLKQAVAVLPTNLQPFILEALVQIDGELSEIHDGYQEYYCKDALEALNTIVDNGWDSYSTHNSMAVLYQKLGQIDVAWSEVEKMEEQYGFDYNIAKRRAFLEIDKQELHSNKNRDYSDFSEYYQQAMDNYDASKDDVEMDLLRLAYRNVQEGGWI